MKYLLLAYGDRSKNEALGPGEFEAIVETCRALDEKLRATGKVVTSQSLEWDSICLRPQGGRTVTTDGPYMETKEQVGGWLVIEAEDREEAIRLASMHPAATLGEELGWGIELRPFAGDCHP